jgi:putative transposase
MPQSLSCLLVHIVFSTKNRRPFIDPAIEPELHAYLGGICRDMKSPALDINGAEDHVHILCSLSKTVCVADLIEEIKTGSSKWIKTKGHDYAAFYWQTGYSAFSIGRSGEAALKRYIARQKEHHRKVSFQDELRTFLRKYGVEYDERYIWD